MPPDPLESVLREVRALLSPLKRYKVEKVLGSGAMGSVVLVRHDVLGRRALKLINPSYLKSETLRRRFFNEARVMARLRGRHIVEVYEVDDVEGYPYIIMEYLEGGTLLDHLVEFGAMPARQAVQVTVALLEALETAHSHCDEEGNLSPIVHRDVKAENVLLTKSGTPKLGDFGIAHMEGGTKQLTADVTTLGTLAYMAPEQKDAKNVDGRADQYALGVLLYVMLTAPEKLWLDTFHAMFARNPTMMDGLIPEIVTIMKKATAENRDDRYESAAAMMEELRAVFAHLPEDPVDTIKLGTAPEMERLRKQAEQVSRAVEAGGEHVTLAPGNGSLSSEGGLASQSDEVRPRSVPPSVATSSRAEAPVPNPWGGTLHGGGTQSGTQFGRELAVTRDTAKRRFFLALSGMAVVLVIAVMSVWYLRDMRAPDDPIQPVVQVEPEPAPAVTPKVESAVPVSAPMQVTPTAPIKIEKKTPKTVVAVKTPAEGVPETEPAMVRLILKEDTVATINLVGEGGTFSVSPADTTAKLPEGTYQATVQMEGRDGAPQTGMLTVTPGITTITCTARFKKCTGIK